MRNQISLNVGGYLRKAALKHQQRLIQLTLLAGVVPMKLYVGYDQHSKFQSLLAQVPYT